MGAKENDLNTDTFIGLELPLKRNINGYFRQTKTTIEQAKHNLKNLLLTIPGERVGQPTFGSKLHHVIFDPNRPENLYSRVNDIVREAVKIWLPYIVIENVNVAQDEVNEHNLDIEIKFSIIFDPERFETITLNLTTPSN